MYQQAERTRNNALRLIRLGLVIAFFVLVGRLYQLQIIQGPDLEARADVNRFRSLEVPPPRGVIYDRNGEILARNRPSFIIAVTPADLPDDDISTELNEEALAMERILRELGVESDPAIALSVGEVMFRRLGRADFARTVQDAGVDLQFRVVRLPVIEIIENEDGTTEETISNVPTIIPDLSQPLPIEGLTALLMRAVALGTQGSSFAPIPILDLVDQELAFRMAEEGFQLPGIQVLQEPVREYPFGDVASHVLGFMGPIPAQALEIYQNRGYTNPNERVGLNGLEYSYQDQLRGVSGQEVIEVDILGRKNRTVGQILEPVPGLNLYLSLDIKLQQRMHEVLQAMLEQRQSPHGVAIAMNPKTGSILGLVSLPSFDNNIFSEGLGADYLALEDLARDDPNRNPLINYAIGGLYPPGSTFKMVTAMAALVEGIVGPETRISDNGPIYLANRFFPNDFSQAQKFVSWNHKLGIVHGPMTVVDALALSNDIYFYWIAGGYPNALVGLGSERLARWTRLHGYGETTGIDLPGEVTAIVPDDQWKRINLAESWTTGDSYNASIGQGYILGTPLQVLVQTAVVANGGYIIEPRLVYQMVDAEGGLQQDYETVTVRELPVSKEILSYVQEGMWAVVNAPAGTARASKVEGVTVAGKTGTAEFCAWDPEIEDCSDRDNQGNLPFHAWYVAYAPYEDPEIAVVVFVYDGGEGSSVAVPVTQQILDFYFNGPPPELEATPETAEENNTGG
ncbi:penicillin-binding protein 2 [bacterium]|nr:penicillin-binding protein 2 [bacterium]